MDGPWTGSWSGLWQAEDEWKSKVAVGDGFVRDVLSKPKLFLIGGPNELGEVGGEEPR
jgi:hypothetical protein